MGPEVVMPGAPTSHFHIHRGFFWKRFLRPGGSFNLHWEVTGGSQRLVYVYHWQLRNIGVIYWDIYIIIFIHWYHSWFIVLETYLPIYPSTHLAIWLSTYLPIYLPIHLSICHSVRLSIPDLSDIYPTYKALFSVSNWFKVPRSSHEGNGKILSRREESAGILTRNDFVRIMDGRYITPENVTGTTI